MKFPIVTPDDHGIRPAGSPDQCFYCKSKVGEEHKHDCVVVTKAVKVKVTLEFYIEVPHSWDQNQIEFHRNEGTWCSSNLQNDIERYREATNSCMCSETKVEYVETVDETPKVMGNKYRTIEDQ